MMFCFSGTGNSKWIAEQIARAQNKTFVFTPNVIRDGIKEFVLADNEKVGFIFPVHSWGLPLAMLQFLDWVTLVSYHSQYVYFVCSCENGTGLTEKVFCRVLPRKGIECNVEFPVTMPNSYVLLPGFDVDKRESEKEGLEKTVGRVEEVSYSIDARKTGFYCNEGSFPWLEMRIPDPLFNRFMTSAKPFYVTDGCIGCRHYEGICPAGDVAVIGWRPVWGMDCTFRSTRYHVCPEHAVQYGKRTRSRGQYLNPNVNTLHESAKWRVL